VVADVLGATFGPAVGTGANLDLLLECSEGAQHLGERRRCCQRDRRWEAVAVFDAIQCPKSFTQGIQPIVQPVFDVGILKSALDVVQRPNDFVGLRGGRTLASFSRANRKSLIIW
jgi:hypothetical protein